MLSILDHVWLSVSISIVKFYDTSQEVQIAVARRQKSNSAKSKKLCSLPWE
jgi:hypothetical protein